MVFRCSRCEEKDLRCFVDTVTGCCASCIAAHAECELFVPEEEWEKVEKEKREKRLELLRVEEESSMVAARVARLRRELAEVESREQEFARRDLALARAQEQKEVVESAIPPIPVFDPPADSGWSQANVPLLDPSLDLLLNNFLADNPVLSPSGSSSSDFLSLIS